MKAWLITWEWTSDSAAVIDEVAAILSPRYSGDRVACIVEFLYAKRHATACEMAAFAGRPSKNPYRAGVGITCGHHPWLHGRKVDDLRVSKDPKSGVETVTWIEPELYKLRRSGHPKRVRDSMPGKSVRRITGPLSDELVWDRSKNVVKSIASR